MANSIFTRNRRLYVVPITTFGTAVPPTNTNATRYIDSSATPTQEESLRPDLNPSLSLPMGVLGRKTCPVQGSCSLACASGPGVAPDIGPIFKACMGTETIAAGTSVTYSEDDAMDFIDMYQYVMPSTGCHEGYLSSVIKTLDFSFGGNYAEVKWTGECKSYVTSQGLTALDTEGKCGLVSFPTEPATPIVNGAAISGYRGTITLDGNAYTIVRNGRLVIDNNAELQKDGWGTDYPQSGVKGIRTAIFDNSLYDDDSSQLNALKGKADLGTPVNVSFQLGNTPGGIYTFTLKNVLLSKPVPDNSQIKRIINFNGSKCHATTGTSSDAIAFTIT